MSALLARLRASTHGSPALSAEVWTVLLGVTCRHTERQVVVPAHVDAEHRHWRADVKPSITESVDAALKQAEAMGWTTYQGGKASAGYWFELWSEAAAVYIGTRDTLALAICDALVQVAESTNTTAARR